MEAGDGSAVKFRVFAAMAMAAGAMSIDSILPAFSRIRGELHLPEGSSATAGLLTLFFVGSAIGQIPMGLFADRFGRRTLVSSAAVVYLIGIGVVAISSSLGAMLVGRFVWGFGAAGLQIGAISMLRDRFVGARMAREMAFVMAIEKLLDMEIPEKATWMRMCLCELNRIHSHLVWLGTAALEIGAISMFWYALRERETILDLFEMVTGVRMHTRYFQAGGLAEDIPTGFYAQARAFCDQMPKGVDDYESMLDKNKIWLERTVGLGLLSADDAIALGQSGPALRASGVNWDLRRDNIARPTEGELDSKLTMSTFTANDDADDESKNWC